MSLSKTSTRIFVVCMLAAGLCGCSTLDLTREEEPVRARSTAKMVDDDSSVETSQIVNRTGSSDLSQRQIAMAPDGRSLSVSQLRTYVDRCSPNALQRAGQDLDCSEINLRIRRLFRNDDEVVDALAVLDRLGTTRGRASTDTEIFVQRALAAGAISTTEPAPAPEEEPDIDAILQGTDLGAIVSATQGR